MIQTYQIYNTTTGLITKTLTLETDYGIASVTFSTEAGEAHAIGNGSSTTHYVVANAVVDRLNLANTNSWSNTTTTVGNIVTFGNALPNPTFVVCRAGNVALNNGAVAVGNITVTDGELEFSAAVAGDYDLEVDAFPYLPYNQLITVV